MKTRRLQYSGPTPLLLMLPVLMVAVAGFDALAEPTNAAPTSPLPPASSTSALVAPSTNLAAIKRITLVSELNNEDKEMKVAFVYVPGKENAPFDPAPLQTVKAELEAKWEIQIGLFTLKPESPENVQLATQMSVPGVMVILKGGGRCPVRGSITESNLINGFYGAMSAGGCCPFGTDDH